MPWVRFGRCLNQSSHEQAIFKLEERFSRPGGPVRRSNECAASEPGFATVTTVRHQPAARIVHERAIFEGEVTDRLIALGFQIDPCAGSANNCGAPRATESAA